MKTMNANIKTIRIEPTDDLNNKLNEFDSIIAETFGDEVAYIKHQLWNNNISFTTVKFDNGDYIGFRVCSKMIFDDTFNASKEHLNKAFRAFGIAMPSWMHC
jgi:hypothetical protein